MGQLLEDCPRCERHFNIKVKVPSAGRKVDGRLRSVEPSASSSRYWN